MTVRFADNLLQSGDLRHSNSGTFSAFSARAPGLQVDKKNLLGYQTITVWAYAASKNRCTFETLSSPRKTDMGLCLNGYRHRHNENGTIDSICVQCFATVATCNLEADLNRLERGHTCDPLQLEYLRELLNRTDVPLQAAGRRRLH